MTDVEDGVGPQRIEVELTPHDPSSHDPHEARRRRQAGPVESSVDEDVHTPGVLGTERGRLIAVGAFAATAALMLGVFVGRLGSSDAGITNAAPSTSTDVETAAERTTTTTRGGRADTLPPAPAIVPVPPATIAAPTTTTTTLRGDPERPERLVTGRIDIDPAVPVSPVEVVALTDRGELVRIDVATGTTVTTMLEGIGRFGPPAILAGDAWILVQNLQDGQGYTVVHDDGTRGTLTAGLGWPLVANRDGGTYWSTDAGPSGGPPSRLVEIDVAGVPTGAEIDLDGFYPQMTDPRGGVVVQAPGGYYLLSAGSPELFTSGRLLAIGVDRAVVQECDESLDCGYFLIDRSTGARTPLELAPELTDPTTSIEAAGWWMFSEPMSPAGDALVAYVWMADSANGQSIGVIDLDSGEYQEIGEFFETPTSAWAPDGRSVYVLERGRLQVFDRSTGRSTPFAEDLGVVVGFVLRPTERPDVGTSSGSVSPESPAAG